MIVRGTNLEMVRGDTERLTVSREDASGDAVPFEIGDAVYLTVKTSPDTTYKAFQVTVTSFTDGKAIVEITPALTSGLDTGRYVYDVQLTEASGDITTLVKMSEFWLSPEVTYD